MNSTLKIILALKLKILLIGLSIGGSFLIEGKLAREKPIKNFKEMVFIERIYNSDTISGTAAIDTPISPYVAEKKPFLRPDAGDDFVINNLRIEIEL